MLAGAAFRRSAADQTCISPLSANGLGTNASMTCEWFEDDLPGWIEAELHLIYSNVFATLNFMRIAEDNFTPKAFVTRRLSKPVDILIFTHKGSVLEVRSAVQRIDPLLAAHFADQAFKRFPTVKCIKFQPMMVDRVQASALLKLSGRPYQAIATSEDFVSRLPCDADAYRKALAKSTRRGLTRDLKRLANRHPDFTLEVHGPDVEERTLDEIFRLHYKRMQARRMRSGIDAQYRRRIVALVREYGLVGVLRIDGRVAAGSINYVTGQHLYSEAVAHDPEYDSLHLGVLCTYLMILEGIDRNIREWHFLWGASEYKRRLGGAKHDLVAITVYASRAAALRYARCYLSQAISNRVRALRLAAAEVRGARAAMSRIRMISNGVRTGLMPRSSTERANSEPTS